MNNLDKAEIVKVMMMSEEEYNDWKKNNPLHPAIQKFLEAQKRMWESQSKMFEAVKEAIKVTPLNNDNKR
jgi:hypothetical protein